MPPTPTATPDGNIRPTLFGRVRKHLPFALAEIFLVVSGVLLAFELETCNKEYEEQDAITVLLEEMYVNLARDSMYLDTTVLRATKAILRANDLVLDHLETGHQSWLPTDTNHYAFLFGSTVLRTNTTAYDNLKAMGVDRIKDHDLRRAITVLYSERYPYLHEIEYEVDNRMQWHLLAPQLISNLSRSLNRTAAPVDFTLLRANHQFQETLRMCVVIRRGMLKEYLSIKVSIRELMRDIQQELNRKQGA